MGTDVRKLVKDGYPAQNVFGSDLRQEFLDVGYDLYGDKESCGITFFSCDVLSAPAHPEAPAPSSSLAGLRGHISHIYTGSLFHLFDASTQFAIALRVVTLLKRDPGAIIFGRHRGSQRAGDIHDSMRSGKDYSCVLYAHDPETWASMWKDAFTQIEGEQFARDRVFVRVKLSDMQDPMAPRILSWSVSIV